LVSTKWYKLKQMKARLKSTQQEEVTRLSDMKKGQFAVVTSKKDNGHIVFRPLVVSNVFAIDLTDGRYWSNNYPEKGCREVRILRAGELIEIVE